MRTVTVLKTNDPKMNSTSVSPIRGCKSYLKVFRETFLHARVSIGVEC